VERPAAFAVEEQFFEEGHVRRKNLVDEYHQIGPGEFLVAANQLLTLVSLRILSLKERGAEPVGYSARPTVRRKLFGLPCRST